MQEDLNLIYPKLQTVTFSNKLIGLCHQARNTQNNRTLFDLSQTEFLSPFGIILLAGTISECLSQNKECTLRSPQKSTTRKFLSGIGFNKFFKMKNGDQRIQSPNVQLKRLRNIDYLLTDQILQVFGNYLRMSEGVNGSLKMALNELMTNAFDHSGSQMGCYVCAQSYRGTKKIRLCIADFGIGILASLKKMDKYNNLNDDNEAITLAVQEGVTSRKNRTGGYGLTHINRFIEINGGKMYILLGTGKVLWNYSGEKKRRETKQTVRFPFEGTAIDILINADKEGFYFLKSEEEELFPRE